MDLRAELNKDPKKMAVLAAIIAAIALVGYFQLLIKPQAQSFLGTMSKVNKLRAELKAAEADISKIAQMKASIASHDAKLGQYGDLLPTEQGIPALLESLADMARSSNMKIVSIVPVEEKELRPQRAQAYQAIPISISAKAGYHELGRFFSTLENSGRFMKIADVRIKSSTGSPKRHDVELLVMTYVLVESK